jgi:hypothetical protein
MFTVSEPAPPRHGFLLKTPVSIAPDALDFRRLIGCGETVGWAEATAEPLFLTRLLDAQAECCPPFRVFFPLTFSDSLAAGHPNVTVTALGGAGAERRFLPRAPTMSCRPIFPIFRASSPAAGCRSTSYCCRSAARTIPDDTMPGSVSSTCKPRSVGRVWLSHKCSWTLDARNLMPVRHALLLPLSKSPPRSCWSAMRYPARAVRP